MAFSQSGAVRTGPSEDSFCWISSLRVWLPGEKEENTKCGEADNGSLRQVSSRRASSRRPLGDHAGPPQGCNPGCVQARFMQQFIRVLAQQWRRKPIRHRRG